MIRENSDLNNSNLNSMIIDNNDSFVTNKARNIRKDMFGDADIQSEQFRDTVKSLQDIYKSNSANKPTKHNNITITEDDFKLLSKFEKNSIRAIANIYGLLNDPKNTLIDYNVMRDAFDKLAAGKNDIEKHYLLTLFFPEKVKNIHIIYPFPIPTYTYVQKFQVFVQPNINGCFLAQVVCPLLIDNSPVGAGPNFGNLGPEPYVWTGGAGGTVSNLYINNNAALDGTILGLPQHFTPVPLTQTVQNSFNTYVLQCSKLSAKYVGRNDVLSGYFGASYHLSPVNNRSPDASTTQFHFVNESINGVISDVTEGINAVYYPPDYSYMNFLKVNQDSVSGGQMSTSLRLNIYGASLPPPNVGGGVNNSAGVVLSFVVVWNVIPTPQYSDLLPLDYNLEEQGFDMLEASKFIPQSGLIVHKTSQTGQIERMLELPSHVRQSALNQHLYNMKNFNRKKDSTILDVLNPIIGTGEIPRIIIDKETLLAIRNKSNDRKDSINSLNSFINN